MTFARHMLLTLSIFSWLGLGKMTDTEKAAGEKAEATVNSASKAATDAEPESASESAQPVEHTETHEENADRIPIGECPGTFLAWNEARQSLRSSTRLVDVFALGVLLEKCSKIETQKNFFGDGRFLTCMQPIRSVTSMVQNSAAYQAKIIELNTAPNIPPSAYQLPAPMQSPELYKALHSKDEKVIEAAIAKIEEANPSAVTFRYVSRIPSESVDGHRPDTKFYVTIYEENGVEKIVHYDELPNLIMISKVSKDSAGKAVNPPKFLMGSMANVFEFENPTDPQVMAETKERGEEGEFQPVLLASNLKQGIDISGKTLQCGSCHQGTKVMPILPQKPEATKSYSKKLKNTDVVPWFNKNYVKAVASDHPQMHAFLPPFGESDPNHNLDFVKNFGKLKDEKSATKVLAAMNCSQCHDRSVVDPIVFPFAFLLGTTEVEDNNNKTITEVSLEKMKTEYKIPPFERLVLDIMLDSGHMPPKADDIKHAKYLTGPERTALEDCLLIDYLGKLYPLATDRGYKGEGKLLTKLLEHPCPVQ